MLRRSESLSSLRRLFLFVLLFCICNNDALALSLSNLNILVSENKVPNPNSIDLSIETFALEDLTFETDLKQSRQKYYININQIVMSDAINIYLITKEQFGFVGVPYQCGCKALVVDGIRYIFCDATFLRDFSKDVERSFKPRGGGELATAVRSWIVGHEVAHHHLDHPMLYQRMANPFTIKKYEREADAIAANAFVDLDLQKSVYGSYFNNALDGQVGSINSIISTIADYLDQLGGSHDNMNRRFSDFVDTIKYVFPSGEQYRTIDTPVKDIFAAPNCTSGVDLPVRNFEEMARLFLGTKISDRDLFIQYFSRMNSDIRNLPDSNAEIRTLLLFEYCQSLVVSINGCQVEFEGNESNLKPSFIRDIMHIISQQNELLRKNSGKSNEYRIDELLQLADKFTQPMYIEYNGEWFPIALTYLTYLHSENRMYNCGSAGNSFGSSNEEYFSCERFAKGIRSDTELDSNELLEVVNLMEAMDTSDPRGMQAKTDLTAIVATQFPLGDAHPFVVSALNDIVVAAKMGKKSEFVIFAFYAYLEIGDDISANALIPFIIEAAKANFYDFIERSIVLTDAGDACVSAMVAACAIRAYDEAGAAIEEALKRDNGDASTKAALQHWLRTNRTARVKANVLGGVINEKLLREVENESSLESGEGAVGTYEILAESFIWLGDSKRAREYFDHASRIASGIPARDDERRMSSLTYEVAIYYLEENWQGVIDALRRLDILMEKDIGVSISGSLRPFAISGQLVPGRLIKLEAEQNVAN